MQVFHVSPPSQVELPSSGSAATATDAGDGFSQVLARQQSEQSAGAASGQPSGTSPASSPSADASEADVSTQADSQAGSKDAKGHADASGPAGSSPLADMVRELTVRSRAVAAGSLERSAAQAGRNADAATPRLLDRTARPAQDGDAAKDLAIALDPAAAGPDGTPARKPAAQADEATDALLPHEQAMALMTPAVDARTPMAALRTRATDAALPGMSAAAGRNLSTGQGLPEASSPLAQAGSLRDARPGLAGDALAARDLGLAARRDGLIPAREADTLVPDGKPLSGQSFESLFANALSGAQAGDAMPALSPVSTMAPAVTAMAPGVTSAGPILTGSIAAPLGSPQWAPSFSEQMVQIGTQQGGTLHHAELRLDPPDLGPLRVSISMQGDQATATFISPHASVRSAVEAALPQLMQALADAGISLGDTSVGEQDAREFAAENTRRGSGTDTNDVDDGHAPAQTVVPTRPRGLVDTFA